MNKKKVPHGSARGSAKGGIGANLTPTELEVLTLLTKEFLTVQKAAIRRNCTPRAIRKIRQKLKNKGYLSLDNKVPQQVPQTGGPSRPSEPIRLHAEHFSINVLWCDERYRKKVKSGVSQFMLEGHTVICYRNKLEVYSNRDFWGSTPDAAKVKSLSYWAKFFVRLESSVNCILVKNGSQNISLVRAEYAEVGNELARKALVEREKVRVVGEDGKTWLLIDNSFKFEELEAVHRSRSKDDMQNVVQPFFNDLRSGGDNVLLPQRSSEVLLALQESVLHTQKQLQSLIESQRTILMLQGLKPPKEPELDSDDDGSLPSYFG